ncbi:DNA polymerase Y family protein [Paracoccus litorisediminis]|uniref:Y-family DNA polymerase n=1 Tax=Paracoccus litorisediminis TaxID=2006130 RepID=UPI0037333231
MARRLLAIWFPRLASEISLRTRPLAGPFALTHRAGNADHLRCLNAEAEARGLYRGMALADARAILPELATRPSDSPSEIAGLKLLRRWADRYAPQIATDGEDGLIADITGVAHLFGGEEELRDDLQARLARAGLSARSAIAGSRGGAHALARHDGGIVPDGLLAERLGPLPVSALRIPPATAEGLARMGLVRISDLIPLPRAPLARRFGRDLVQRLDQMLGTLPEPVGAESAPPHFGVRMILAEPIGLTADVMAGLEHLLERLCAKLAAHHMGARRLCFELHRVDKETVTIEIGLARAMREPKAMAALFRSPVDEVDSGFGIDALRLEAIVTEPLAPQQIGNMRITQADELADLILRLGNRLGFEHVLRFLPVESQLPERTFRQVPAAYSAPSPLSQRPRPRRPVLIFPPEPILSASGHPPARFRWRRMRFTTLRAAGPERITPDWWQDDPAWRSGTRDYWRIETCEGLRLWLFHTPMAPGWQIQGTFL